MAEITLKDIMISARQESYRMRHFYLGVEHTVIALLEINGGLTSNILQEQGLAPDYIIDAIRRKVGKGSRHRLWAGIPNTPRTEVVLGIANDLALETGRKEIIERDMLLAILEERDSVPIRVFESLGLDVSQLIEMARTYGTSTASQQSFVTLDFGTTFDRAQSLSKDQLFVLRRMFRDYTRIRVDARLSGGYTAATLLVVTPIRGDGREDAAVVVKLDKTATILDEAQRYETHVRGTLPPLTARLEAKPTAPDTSELAAIRYTLVAESGAMPRDLRSVIGNWDGEKLGRWIAERLFSAFGRIWWQQRRPYRFQVWREYDWLLPPLLILEAAKSEPPQENVLRFPLKREKLAEL